MPDPSAASTARPEPVLDQPDGLNEAASGAGWGSDFLAQALRDLAIPYIALNPGASYRGLHDSIVNHLGNVEPSMLVCLHEEHAVAIAHGYAKVSGRPMAVGLHSNVGLMHATMAIYNAFCDRVPMLIVGAGGPFDAAKRRPWIDWVHTAVDQASMIRPYVKWDDQPGSVEAAVESLVRAHQVTTTYPTAPTYVCLDAAMQEEAVAEAPRVPAVARAVAPSPPAPGSEDVAAIVDLLEGSPRTVLLVGRVGSDAASWEQRVRLADALDAQVITDWKLGAVFPTGSERHAAVPGALLTPSGSHVLREATAILSLGWADLAGALTEAGIPAPDVAIVHCSLDHVLHNGWSKDGFGLAPVDIGVQADPDALVGALLEADLEPPAESGWPGHLPVAEAPHVADPGELKIRDIAATLRNVLDGRPASLVRVPIGWDGADLDRLEQPLDYLGYDGAAGIGSGPGMAVGAALGLMGRERLPIAVLGDGDTLMGATALWTAARHRIPLLVIVANNQSFYNDEMHQERMALKRGRPPGNRWIGQRISDPAPDFAVLAGSLGVEGIGPVGDHQTLTTSLRDAVERVGRGATVLVDVRVGATDYAISSGPEE